MKKQKHFKTSLATHFRHSLLALRAISTRSNKSCSLLSAGCMTWFPRWGSMLVATSSQSNQSCSKEGKSSLTLGRVGSDGSSACFRVILYRYRQASPIWKYHKHIQPPGRYGQYNERFISNGKWQLDRRLKFLHREICTAGWNSCNNWK